MHLNEIGKVATQYWEKIPNHFPFVELGNYIVIPNSLHEILIISKINGCGIVKSW